MGEVGYRIKARMYIPIKHEYSLLILF